MAQPGSRSEFIDYCKRQLGAPVLEINVADEQIEDIVDDAIQFFNERHFDGVMQTYLKYQLTQDDIDRGQASVAEGSTTRLGITTTTANATIPGMGTTSFNFYENSNYLQVPPEVIGVTKVFHFDGTNTVTNNMFSIKYQLFLNDVNFFYGSSEILSYAMVKRYLEDINFLLTTEKQIRFNQRMDRLYLDIDWGSVTVGDFLILDCFRLLNPNDYSRVWNDSFLKPYTTALLKRQWGQNLMKFTGVKLPGGVELNGRQMFDDAEKELERIRERMSNTYEIPPLDMIG
jgi:hypothetical protein|tara:strand:- start:255 stop:1115 length:861 start_codon:yes stop_codon:yes gene_type:complete